MHTHQEFLYSNVAKHARKDDALWAVGGLVVAGGVAAVTSNLLVGGAIAVLGYGLAAKQIHDDGKRIRVMAEAGAVAPFLKGEDYEKYVDAFGTAEADKQAMHALRLGVQPYGDALDGLEQRHPEFLKQLDEATTQKPGRTYFNPLPVGPVNASLTDAPLFAPATEQPPATQPPDTAYQFLRKLTESPLQPVIIAGLPGSGKGVLAAIALSIGFKENGLRFRVFNPKPKLTEAGYWSRAEAHYLKNRLQHDDDLFTDLMAVLEEFSAEGSSRNDTPGDYPPYVLLLEEINAVIGLFTPKQKQLFKAKITALASLLRGCNMAIWASGQSVTLEDLGLTGKSNRAMFTAIVAVGEERESVGAFCQMLGINFDNSRLQANKRYWLTATGIYEALPCPQNVPTYPDWGSVPNLIDLRPGANETPTHRIDSLLADVEQQEQSIATVEKPPVIIQDDPRSVARKLEDSYKLSAPDEFVTDTQKSLTGLQPDHEDIAAYILERGECAVGSIKNWAKTRRKGSLSAEAVDEILIDLIDLQLIETFNPSETRAEWVRWIVTR